MFFWTGVLVGLVIGAVFASMVLGLYRGSDRADLKLRIMELETTPDPHEIWAAAQLMPGEGIEDGVRRIEDLMKNHAPRG